MVVPAVPVIADPWEEVRTTIPEGWKMDRLLAWVVG